MNEGYFIIDANVWSHKTKDNYEVTSRTTSASGKVIKENNLLMIRVWNDDTSEIICEMTVSDILFALHDFIEHQM